ncbi:MAG: PEP-CTERM sorting domain-containing protein [Planctomycetota bacterium]|nr:MAG: PEP-CTERM sorting domain-containing protein [Planctomycetota bacterium]REK47884.1 MAG: PEP-CTERM sorting domain-containing protein [Planctomycetota bacterium]
MGADESNIGVPEPSTYGLALLVLIGFGTTAWRRRRVKHRLGAGIALAAALRSS